MATATQIQQELDTWRVDQGDYYRTPQAIVEELSWGSIKTIEIPSGTVTLADEHGGGEGDGEERFIVLKVGDQLFQYVGYYSSWSGTEWDDDLYEVEPYEVTVTKYRVKKEN